MNKLIKKLEKVVDEYSLFKLPAPVTELLDEKIRSLEKDIKEFKSPNGPNIVKIIKLPLENKVIVAEKLNTIEKLNYKRDEEREKQRRLYLEPLKKLHEVIIAVLNEIIFKLHELYKTGKSEEIVKSIKAIDTILQQTNEQENDGYGYLKKDFKSYVNFIKQLDYSLLKLPFEDEGIWFAYANNSKHKRFVEFGEEHFLTKTLLYSLYSIPSSMSLTDYKEILRKNSRSINWDLRLNEQWISVMEQEIKLLSKLGVLYYSARSGEIRPNRFGEFLIYETPYDELQFKEFCYKITKILSWKREEFTNSIMAWPSSSIPLESELQAFLETQKCLRAKQKVDQIRKLLKSEYGLDLLG